MKIRELEKLLIDAGWFLQRVSGHRIYAHEDKPGVKLIVPNHPSKELATGTLNSILKQAGLK